MKCLLVVSSLVLASAMAMATPIANAREAELERFDFSQRHMGVEFRILLYASDADAAKRAAEAAFARIAELDGKLSDYNPDSELSKLSRSAGSGEAVKVSDDLWTVLKRSQELAEASDGAFDVTVGQYVRLWRRARRQKEIPSPDRMAEASAATGWRHLRLDCDAQTAELVRPNMRLDLGGIAMGFAVDEALKVLREAGAPRALVDASGDFGAWDPPPGEPGWRIGIVPIESADAAPTREVFLCRNAVTTSGDAYQHVEIDGVRYSHIVNPKTGLGLTDRSMVTVIANDCTAADAMATTVSVLGPEKGLKLIEATEGAEAAILYIDADGKKNLRLSSGFDALARPIEGREPGKIDQ